MRYEPACARKTSLHNMRKLFVNVSHAATHFQGAAVSVRAHIVYMQSRYKMLRMEELRNAAYI
jgi:hypothetical protein